MQNPGTIWRVALVCVAMFGSLLGMTNIASAATCSTNCIKIYSAEMRDMGSYVHATVKFTDENNTGIRNFRVDAQWIRPDGTVLKQSAYVGTRMRAEFRLSTSASATSASVVPGTYELEVIDATKAYFAQ